MGNTCCAKEREKDDKEPTVPKVKLPTSKKKKKKKDPEDTIILDESEVAKHS